MTPASRRIAGLTAATILVAATLPISAVASTPPPTLTGEFLSAFPDAIPTSSVDIVASCADGMSTISWSASGEAFGPYPGTFVETGSATVGPQTAPAFVNGLQLGYLLSVEAFFSIESPIGQVIGSKRLTAVSSFDLGGCHDLNGFAMADGGIVNGTFRRVVALSMSYEAIVITAGATYLDTGFVGSILEHFSGTGMAEIDAVQESFTSSHSVLVAATGGRATGGGRVGDVTFGFTGTNDKTGAKGRCAVVDMAAEATLKCLSVLSIGVSGNRATIYGDAVFGETSVRYRMEVSDFEESGAGIDSWTIRLSNGYTAGGVLTEGNIQIHG